MASSAAPLQRRSEVLLWEICRGAIRKATTRPKRGRDDITSQPVRNKRRPRAVPPRSAAGRRARPGIIPAPPRWDRVSGRESPPPRVHRPVFSGGIRASGTSLDSASSWADERALTRSDHRPGLRDWRARSRRSRSPGQIRRVLQNRRYQRPGSDRPPCERGEELVRHPKVDGVCERTEGSGEREREGNPGLEPESGRNPAAGPPITPLTSGLIPAPAQRALLPAQAPPNPLSSAAKQRPNRDRGYSRNLANVAPIHPIRQVNKEETAPALLGRNR